MPFVVDPSIPWPEHFIQYGFAVLRNQVEPAFIERALERVRHHVEGEGRDLPFDQWTTRNIQLATKVPGDPVLDAIYDQPGARAIIRTMYGTDQVGVAEGWNGTPAYGLFITPFDPDYKPTRLWGGHIDFGGNMIPLFGNAFVMQVCLRDTEPFGGNITIIPGSHRQVQKRALENPLTQYPYDFADYPFVEPYEHVARAGDVLLMHHLSFHTGNPCGGATRRPRLALHCQVQRTAWLTRADPNDPANCPWVKSFALNGFVEDAQDQERYMSFSTNKKAMWGYWTSTDGRVVYKVFTGTNGSLHARLSVDGGPEQRTQDARFNGRTLTFTQDAIEGWGPGVSGSGEAKAGGGGSVAMAAPCRATMEVDGRDAERMVCRLGRAGEAGVEMVLRRTQAITTRLPG